jgi:hypothetical protein
MSKECRISNLKRELPPQGFALAHSPSEFIRHSSLVIRELAVVAPASTSI